MIHGVYVKSRPKGKWHLVSLTISQEAANFDLNAILKQAKQENTNIQAAIQSYDSSFHIPEILNEIKDQKLLYN